MNLTTHADRNRSATRILDTKGDALAFDNREQKHITALNQALIGAYLGSGDENAHRQALHQYLRTMQCIGQRRRMFEIVNHRLFSSGDSLVVPYDTQGSLTI